MILEFCRNNYYVLYPYSKTLDEVVLGNDFRFVLSKNGLEIRGECGPLDQEQWEQLSKIGLYLLFIKLYIDTPNQIRLLLKNHFKCEVVDNTVPKP